MKSDVRQCLSFIIIITAILLLVGALSGAAATQESPHGLEPADDMAFIPKLDGLRNKTFRNHYGKKKALSEAVVLRRSTIEDGRATVPAAGLFYISETSEDAQPFMRDPFLVLGEHAYLVDLTSGKQVVTDFKVKIGEKVPVANTGYRMWFDYATDHYEKPYAELALISPSGGWPLEFPIATEFPGREAVRDLKVSEGYVDQLEKFYLDKEYFYGATRFKARKIGFKEAEFETVEFPEISQATFSMHRPIVLDVRQEDYRFYFNKRIYAFRRPDGFLVRVTDFWGNKVFSEKLIRPITAQGYKSVASEKDSYHLTIPEL
ncbi:MAG: hypothetical protein JRH15_13890, partial [Deltaproteobacteria bacterium]|nr:hypothetical protein [Deltaproteobacteria bacterium]